VPTHQVDVTTQSWNNSNTWSAGTGGTNTTISPDSVTSSNGHPETYSPYWACTSGTSANGNGGSVVWFTIPPASGWTAIQTAVETPEQREARRERKRQKVDAERRARRLLFAHLDKLQRHVYKSLGYFFVVGGDTGRKYRLRYGTIRNIDVMCADGRTVDRVLCCHPADDVPNEDSLLAQKVMLERCEREFVAMANSGLPNEYDIREWRSSWAERRRAA
jgi:hypothetical protein